MNIVVLGVRGYKKNDKALFQVPLYIVSETPISKESMSENDRREILEVHGFDHLKTEITNVHNTPTVLV